MFGLGNDTPMKEWPVTAGVNEAKGSDMREWPVTAGVNEDSAMPEEKPALAGIPRGFVGGLRQGAGVLGNALQAITPEGTELNKAGKSVEEWSKANATPPQEEGFLEKGAKMVGLSAPLIAAGVAAAYAPEAVAPAISEGLGAGISGLFGLSQAHETAEAMRDKGLDPGMAPVITGGVTAATFALIPKMFQNTFTPAIANMVGEGLASQSATSLMKPSVKNVLTRFLTHAAETQALFGAQTLGVGGTEKAFGLEHDLPKEMLESAVGGAGLSTFMALGIPVGLMRGSKNADTHLAVLGRPLDAAVIKDLPPEKRDGALREYNHLRAGYIEAIGNALEKAGQKDVAQSWRDYAFGRIMNPDGSMRNDPIDVNIPMDKIGLEIEKSLAEAANGLGVGADFSGIFPTDLTNLETGMATRMGAAAQGEGLDNLSQLDIKKTKEGWGLGKGKDLGPAAWPAKPEDQVLTLDAEGRRVEGKGRDLRNLPLGNVSLAKMAYEGGKEAALQGETQLSNLEEMNLQRTGKGWRLGDEAQGKGRGLGGAPKEAAPEDTGRYTFTNRKNEVYKKINGTWYTPNGEIVDNKYQIRNLEKGKVPIAEAAPTPDISEDAISKMSFNELNKLAQDTSNKNNLAIANRYLKAKEDQAKKLNVPILQQTADQYIAARLGENWNTLENSAEAERLRAEYMKLRDAEAGRVLREGTEKKKTQEQVRTGPQNLVTFLQSHGGVKPGEFADRVAKRGKDGQILKGTKDLGREGHPDYGAVFKSTGKLEADDAADLANAEGFPVPAGHERWDSDLLHQEIQAGRGRKIYHPLVADKLTERKLPQQDMTEEDVAYEEEKNKIEEDRKAHFENFDKLAAEKGLTPEQIAKGHERLDEEFSKQQDELHARFKPKSDIPEGEEDLYAAWDRLPPAQKNGLGSINYGDVQHWYVAKKLGVEKVVNYLEGKGVRFRWKPEVSMSTKAKIPAERIYDAGRAKVTEEFGGIVTSPWRALTEKGKELAEKYPEEFDSWLQQLMRDAQSAPVAREALAHMIEDRYRAGKPLDKRLVQQMMSQGLLTAEDELMYSTAIMNSLTSGDYIPRGSSLENVKSKFIRRLYERTSAPDRKRAVYDLPETRERYGRAVEAQGAFLLAEGPEKFNESLLNLIREGKRALTHDEKGYDDPGFRRAWRLASYFGHELVPIKDKSYINGFVNHQSRQIFMEVNGSHPLLNLIGHELSHVGTKDHMPNASVRALINLRSPEFKQYWDGLKVALDRKDVSPTAALKEYAADLQGGIKENFGVKLTDGLLTTAETDWNKIYIVHPEEGWMPPDIMLQDADFPKALRDKMEVGPIAKAARRAKDIGELLETQKELMKIPEEMEQALMRSKEGREMLTDEGRKKYAINIKNMLRLTWKKEHGITDYNRQERFRKVLDIPLLGEEGEHHWKGNVLDRWRQYLSQGSFKETPIITGRERLLWEGGRGLRMERKANISGMQIPKGEMPKGLSEEKKAEIAELTETAMTFKNYGGFDYLNQFLNKLKGGPAEAAAPITKTLTDNYIFWRGKKDVVHANMQVVDNYLVIRKIDGVKREIRNSLSNFLARNPDIQGIEGLPRGNKGRTINITRNNFLDAVQLSKAEQPEMFSDEEYKGVPTENPEARIDKKNVERLLTDNDVKKEVAQHYAQSAFGFDDDGNISASTKGRQAEAKYSIKDIGSKIEESRLALLKGGGPALQSALEIPSKATSWINDKLFSPGLNESARKIGDLIIGEIGIKRHEIAKFKEQLNTVAKKYRTATTLMAKTMDQVQASTGILADTLFHKMKPENQWAYINKIYSGDTASMSPYERDVANVITKMFDEQHKREADIQEMPYRQNYFPGMYTKESQRAYNLSVRDAEEQGLDPFDEKNIKWMKDRTEEHEKKGEGVASKGTQMFFDRRGRLEGSKFFAKPKYFQDLNAAMAVGLKPRGTPLDMAFGRLSEGQKFVTIHHALRELIADKVGRSAVLVKGTDVPAGYVLLPDLVGVQTKDGFLRYAVKEEISPVFKNYMSSSLYEHPDFGTLFGAYMNTANHLNQFQLGFGSAFHAGFMGMEAIISHHALGLKDMFNGNVAEGMKKIIESPIQFGRYPMIGDKILRMYRNETPEGQELPRIIKDIELAGLGEGMDRRFRTTSTDKLVSNLAQKQYVPALYHTPFAAMEQMARPIMEYLVPRVKFGIFSEMANEWHTQNPASRFKDSHEYHQARTRAMVDIGSNVDQRAGQVGYERLIARKAYINAIQGTVRSAGWSGGTILQVAGGIHDLGKFVMAPLKGERPQMTDKLAYTISLMAVTGMINGTLTYLLTGDMPKGKDFYAFRTGKKDEHGSPERFLLPTYAKDIYSYMNDPKKTIVNKAHPVIGLMADIARNKDYYGVEIRDKQSGTLAQAAQSAGYAAKAYIPFWMRGAMKESERGGSLWSEISPLIGVMPATAEFSRTPAQKRISEILAERPRGSMTRADFERHILISSLETRLRNKDMSANAEVQAAAAAGKLSPKDVQNIQKSVNIPYPVHAFKQLSLNEGIDVYNVAKKSGNEEDMKMFRPLLMKKLHLVSNLPPEQRAETMAKIKEVLGEK